jgi:hypothetical protein
MYWIALCDSTELKVSQMLQVQHQRGSQRLLLLVCKSSKFLNRMLLPAEGHQPLPAENTTV